PGTRCVLPAELLGLLSPPGRLQRLVLLTRPQPDDPRLLLRSRALRPERARRASLSREPGLQGHSTLGICIGLPGVSLLARRASYDLLLPIHLKASLVEALAGARLPTRVLGHRADEGHSVLALALDQDRGVGVALVDPVLTRKPILLLQRLMDLFDHIVVG